MTLSSSYGLLLRIFFLAYQILKRHRSNVRILPRTFAHLDRSSNVGNLMLNLEHNADHHYDAQDLGVKNFLGNRRIRFIAHLLPNGEMKAVVFIRETLPGLLAYRHRWPACHGLT